MANLLKMAIVQSILSLHAQGWSARRIAGKLQVHRDTVSRYVRAAAATAPAAPASLRTPRRSRFGIEGIAFMERPLVSANGRSIWTDAGVPRVRCDQSFTAPWVKPAMM